ncbi:MFS transporter [Promicromonospora thailandica]|uniref:Drug resistance transporter, EmrB/QacA subfamily n=1 Tax=Promicromonospora thailandica TaxID=765201 RepID=A0A9X2JY50_9MICO|nr:MFS transporter [Promicromonospora thailandica]MCP2266853.1 drug resistance transporter, EmrB/QacA subfamily [Promicromonospora thailandica]
MVEKQGTDTVDVVTVGGGAATEPDAAPAVVTDPRSRRAILLTVSIALMAVVASVSGLNVAQPHLAATFDAAQGTVLWIINIYTLTLAALLLPLGAAGDRWGRRPVLVLGLVIFGVANITAAVAPTVELMLASRLLAGAGAAMIMPVTLSVITSTFPGEARSRAIGVWTAVAGGGGIVGMYLSALLVDVATWRWLFALPVVLTVVALASSVTAVPNSRQPANGRYDILGAVTSVVVAVGLTFALHEAPALGWAHPAILVTLGLAVAATGAFVAWELHTPAPLLDVRAFRSRGLSSGSVLLLVLFGVQAGISLVLYPYFQVVLGWSGLVATLGLMPLALLMMAASGLAPKASLRFGTRTTMAAGLALAGTGLALMALLVSADGGYLTVLPGLIVLGLGTGLAMTPSTEAITSALPDRQQGVASAINDLTRELGAALGIALLGGLLTAGYQSAIAPRLEGLPGHLARAANEGVANAFVAGQSAGPFAERLMSAAADAFVTGWQQAMWVGVALAGALFVFVLSRAPRTVTAPSDSSTEGTA